MRQILSAQIRKIELPEIPFAGDSMTTAPVNYFYGENGTGKTTLAKQILDGRGLGFDAGYSPADICLLHFDSDYIERCFRSRERIPGIFSTRGIREEAAREIRRLKERLADQRSRAADLEQQIVEVNRERGELFDRLKKHCWKATADFRGQFPLTLRGSRSSSEKLTLAILDTPSAASMDLEEFRRTYESAWGKDVIYYDKVMLPPDLYAYQNLPVESYMQRRILTGGSSEFASFIKVLQAADWIREGREKYLQPGQEICPFCGQPLPQDLEERLTELFDENYEQEMAAMRKYFRAYRDEMNRIFQQIQRIMQAPAPEGAAPELPEHAAELRQAISGNLEAMKQKEAHPDREYSLQDLSGLLEEIGNDIVQINRRITRHNTILDSQKEYQTSANRKAWAYLADLVRDDTEIYRGSLLRNEAQAADLAARKSDVDAEIISFEKQIREWEEMTSNTREAMEEINQILRASRYQGFTLRERAGEENLYEVVYSDGRIAESLSEGEYRMLTFLYFCQQALKRTASPDTGRQKVLVIDDPTTGLDQRARKVVVSMIRRLAAVCLGNAPAQEDPDAEIEQIFLFTHDLEFYRQLMDSYDLESASPEDIAWYQLRKRNEKTIVQRRGE